MLKNLLLTLAFAVGSVITASPTCVELDKLSAANNLGSLAHAGTAYVNGTNSEISAIILDADANATSVSLNNVIGIRYQISSENVPGLGNQCEFRIKIETYTDLTNNRYFSDVGYGHVGCVDRSDNVIYFPGFNDIDNGADATAFKILIVHDKISHGDECSYTYNLEYLSA